MPRLARLIAAFIFAPVCVGLILFVVSLFQGQPGNGWWALQFNALIAYPIAAVIGVPAYMFLQHKRWTDLPVYLLASLAAAAPLIGFFVVLPAFSIGDMFEGLGPRLSQTGLIIVAVGISAATFWFIARPDLAPATDRPSLG